MYVCCVLCVRFTRGELEFSHTLDLKNPWNDSKPVKISRDGQVKIYFSSSNSACLLLVMQEAFLFLKAPQMARICFNDFDISPNSYHCVA